MKRAFFTYIIFLFSFEVVSAQAPRTEKHPHGFNQGGQAKTKRSTEPITVVGNRSVFVKRNYKNPHTDAGDAVAVAVPFGTPKPTGNPLTNPNNYKRQNRPGKQVPKPEAEKIWAEDSVRTRQ